MRSYLILFLVLLNVLVVSQRCECGPTIQSNNTKITHDSAPLTHPEKYSWVNLKYHDGNIIAVGNRKLPIPITFPRDIIPIGKEALLGEHSEKSRLEFYLYFSMDSEIKIKKLIWKFPKNLPFLQGYYSSDSLRIDKRDIGITWHALVFVKGKFDFADISFLPTTLSVSKNDLNGTDPDTVGMRKLLQAWSMDSSPVHKIKKAVEVRFYYNNAQN